MNIVPTAIRGCYKISAAIHRDHRGTFTKIFNDKRFGEYGIERNYKEVFITTSKRGVLRGMHFQEPPYDQNKLVYCSAGKVLDVAVDLRVGSPTFGGHEAVELDFDSNQMLYLPKGLAHGFYTITESASLLYLVSESYSPEHDKGILWNSIGIKWPDTNPVISERDGRFAPFADYKSPFVYTDGWRV